MKLKNADEFTVHQESPHLRGQGDSLKGACAAKCSKFDFGKFENPINPLKGACAPMRSNRVIILEDSIVDDTTQWDIYPSIPRSIT